MIDKKSLVDAVGIAQRLAAAGTVLTSVDQSALQHLVASMKLIATKPENADAAAILVKDAAQCTEHDGTMGYIADHAANSVLNTHRMVTEIINPHIRKVVDEVKGQIDAAIKKLSDSPHDVELVTLPPVMDSDELATFVARVAGWDRYDATPINLGTYTDTEILNLIKYSTPVDEVLEMALLNEPGSFDAINRIFSGEPIHPDRASKAVVVASFLMAQALKHMDIVKEGINATLTEYKNYLHYIAVTLARYMNVIYENWNTIVKNSYIYQPGDNGGKIKILSTTFKDLASNHGVTIENLIGNQLLGNKYFYSDFASEEKEKVLAETKAAYDTDLASINLTKEAKVSDLITRTVLIGVKNDAIERSEDPSALAILGDDKASMISRAGVACETVYKSNKAIRMDQLEECVAGLLIAIYYAHTDALLYLDSIADFAKKYPEMDGVELAKLARVNLIVHWVYRQFALGVKAG